MLHAIAGNRPMNPDPTYIPRPFETLSPRRFDKLTVPLG